MVKKIIVQALKLTLIVLATILLITNPGSEQYELYAADKLTIYLKDNVCRQVTEQVNKQLRSPCHILIDTARPQLRLALYKNTQKQNFFLFSIYQTQLAIAPLTPEYHFATLGICNRFFTYQAEQTQ